MRHTINDAHATVALTAYTIRCVRFLKTDTLVKGYNQPGKVSVSVGSSLAHAFVAVSFVSNISRRPWDSRAFVRTATDNAWNKPQ